MVFEFDRNYLKYHKIYAIIFIVLKRVIYFNENQSKKYVPRQIDKCHVIFKCLMIKYSKLQNINNFSQ